VVIGTKDPEGQKDAPKDEIPDEEGNLGAEGRIRRQVMMEMVMSMAETRMKEIGSKIRVVFEEEKENTAFLAGFLVGGLAFVAWPPSFEKVGEAMVDMGVDEGLLVPMSNESTLPSMVEVRVKRAEDVEAVREAIRESCRVISAILKREFKWRDLRWVNSWVLVMKGIPPMWTEEEVKEVIFRKGGFPSGNLVSIGRPSVARGREGATTIMLRYSTIPLSLLALL
jgi:hypothetical protein